MKELILSLLHSRKFWAFVVGLLTITSTALSAETFPMKDYIQQVTLMVIGYIGSIAFEDGMAKRDSSPTVQVSDPGQVVVTGEVKNG